MLFLYSYKVVIGSCEWRLTAVRVESGCGAGVIGVND